MLKITGSVNGDCGFSGSSLKIGVFNSLNLLIKSSAVCLDVLEVEGGRSFTTFSSTGTAVLWGGKKDSLPLPNSILPNPPLSSSSSLLLLPLVNLNPVNLLPISLFFKSSSFCLRTLSSNLLASTWLNNPPIIGFCI